MDIVQVEKNQFLGYIILFVSLLKVMLPKRYSKNLNLPKERLINCMYRILPMGHYWFNKGLKFYRKDFGGCVKYFGLYEYILVHAVALARTFTEEQYGMLERRMYEAIMGTDCYTALFSSNLWVQLVRTNDELALTTLRSLITIYQKLEKYKPFHNSPQKVHLRYTIRKFFQVLLSESKMLMSKQLSPHNSAWYAAKVGDLPKHQRRNVEGMMLEVLKTRFYECMQSPDATEVEMNNLIQIMKMASTCSFLENTVPMEQYLVKLWSKACRKTERIESNELRATDPLWDFNYLEALVSLTGSIECRFSNSTNLLQVLHSMSTILDGSNEELIFLIFDIFCLLSLHRKEDENQQVIDSIFKDTLKGLLQSDEASIRSYLLNILSKYRNFKECNEIINTMLLEDEFSNEWTLSCNIRDRCFKKLGSVRLIQAILNEFIHKCNPQNSIEGMKSQFDLGDFTMDVDAPPAKKTKLDCYEVDDLVERLESDTLLLSLVKDVTLSEDYKERINRVINKLRNIVH